MNNSQSQALAAFRYRPVVSAVLIVLLALLIFAARNHRGDDPGLGAYSAMDAWQTSSATTTDRPVLGG
ncbi:MAG TPA: hypothetical protein VIW92_02615 [Thermoanaerobaculia bacterium]